MKNSLYWPLVGLLLLWGGLMLYFTSLPQSSLSRSIVASCSALCFTAGGAAASIRLIERHKKNTAEPSPHNETGKEEVPELLAKDIALDDFRSLGMDPMYDDDEIVFRYQGGYFRMANIDSPTVRILYPRIYSVPVDRQNLLYRVLNRVNSSFPLVKLVATSVSEEESVAVHGLADVTYSSHVAGRIDYLRQVLQLFFDTQHALAMSMAAAAMEPMDAVVPEEVMPGQLQDMGLN